MTTARRNVWIRWFLALLAASVCCSPQADAQPATNYEISIADYGGGNFPSAQEDTRYINPTTLGDFELEVALSGLVFSFLDAGGFPYVPVTWTWSGELPPGMTLSALPLYYDSSEGLVVPVRSVKSARVASTGNMNLNSTRMGSVVDGVELRVGDNLLVKNQSNPAENGFYIIGSFSTVRQSINDANSHLGAVVTVAEGSTHGGSWWASTNDGVTWATIQPLLTFGDNLQLSGTPPLGAGGSYSFTVQASYPAGLPVPVSGVPASATEEYTIVVESMILTTDLPNATEESAYPPLQLDADGGESPYEWSIVDGALPVGMDLSPDGILSGTPVSGSSFTSPFVFSVRVEDAHYPVPRVSLREFSLTVLPDGEGELNSIPVGYEGLPYFAHIEAAGAFVGPCAFDILDGLPEGISFDSEAASLSGIFEDDAAGSGTHTYHLVVEVSDSHPTFPQRVEVSLPLVVSRDRSRTFHVATTQLPLAVDGDVYATQLLALGGSRDYTWTTDRLLPEGVSLSESGLVSGVVGDSASDFSPYVLTLTVLDNQTSNTTSVTLPLNVLMEGGIAPELRGVNAALPNAVEAESYDFELEAMGGIAPYSWQALSVPAGLSVLRDEGSWRLRGVPAPESAGSRAVVLEVTDAANVSATISLSLTIAEPGSRPLSFITSALPLARVGQRYGPVALELTGGDSPCILSARGLPDGLELAVSGPVWFIGGTIVDERLGSAAGMLYEVVITATDASGSVAVLDTTLTVQFFALSDGGVPDSTVLVSGLIAGASPAGACSIATGSTNMGAWWPLLAAVLACIGLVGRLRAFSKME
ncbi:MAG: hypothetical protein HUU29_10655 [Planctomycetaceae bacterium]|nr:hypothetical protein [Planctomycetaceae bacterium]